MTWNKNAATMNFIIHFSDLVAFSLAFDIGALYFRLVRFHAPLRSISIGCCHTLTKVSGGSKLRQGSSQVNWTGDQSRLLGLSRKLHEGWKLS